jgi:hypothetical protein
MAKMGLSPIYQRPRTSDPHPQHRVYPYLLRQLAIEQPNHVWCADVTYLPMRRGFLSLVAIMDWASRNILAWRLSNTMDAGFCVAALEEALARFGRPEIFNTDQSSPFTSFAFTSVLRDADMRISMDGRGRGMDNVFIERLWRSLKYECVYLHAFETGSELRAGLARWITLSIGVQTGPPIGAQKGPPLRDGTTVEERSLRCARRREGGARPETRAAQSILIPACGGDQLRFLNRQLSFPVSMMSQ